MAEIVSGIFFNDYKVFFGKESPHVKTSPERWAFPGGNVEGQDIVIGKDGTPDKNKTLENAVRREVLEETGLYFSPTRLYRTDRIGTYVIYRFLGEWSGEIRLLQKEVTDYGWFSYDQATKLYLPPLYLEILDDLHREGLLR